MSKLASAKRYAKALLEVAKEHNAITTIKEEFGSLVETLRTHKEMQMLLTHPQVELEDKKTLLTGALSGASSYLVNFLKLMVDKGREAILTETYAAFVELVNQYEGVVEATITSATLLDQATIDEIVAAFSKQLGKQVRAKNNVDSALLGGIVVRIGDRLYDGSVKGKLNRLSKSLIV